MGRLNIMQHDISGPCVNDYDRLHNLISDGILKKDTLYDTNLYQDVIDSAIENLTCLQSYASDEAATMISNSFSRGSSYIW